MSYKDKYSIIHESMPYTYRRYGPEDLIIAHRVPSRTIENFIRLGMGNSEPLKYSGLFFTQKEKEKENEETLHD